MNDDSRRVRRDSVFIPGMRWLVLAMIAFPMLVHAQAEGARSQLLLPTDTNIFVPTYMHLSGNYNFGGNILLPDVDADSDILVATYTRAFAAGDRYAQVFINPVFGRIDAKGTVPRPSNGQPISVNDKTLGIGDAIVAFKLGLAGAQPMGLADFARQNQGFQMAAYAGVTVPIGDYDSDRLLNLGTNVWALRAGLPMVWTLGPPGTFLEVFPSATLYTDNTDPTRGATRLEQDPLFDVQAHLTRNFSQKFWMGFGFRYRIGGETTTDGVSDGNEQNVLGGGVTAGYAFTSRWSGQLTLGKVLLDGDDSDEDMVRLKIAYTAL